MGYEEVTSHPQAARGGEWTLVYDGRDGGLVKG